AFAASFFFDPQPLAATSTNPPFPGGVFTLPGPFTYDVNFNEAFNPATLQTSDLALSGMAGATVTSVTAVNRDTTARLSIRGHFGAGAASAGSHAGGPCAT